MKDYSLNIAEQTYMAKGVPVKTALIEPYKTAKE